MVWGGALALIALASLADAGTATLRATARLRVGPSVATELLGWVSEGVRVEIIGSRGGWREVRTPGGKTGYIWGEHLLEEEPSPAPEAAPPPEEDRSAPATAADLEGVRVELERLAAAQGDLARRLDERPLTTGQAAEPLLEGTPGLALALLLVGAGLGFAMSRLLQRRRDRRQRMRLRL